MAKLPLAPEEYNREQMQQILSDIESATDALERIIQAGYQISNNVSGGNRVLDVSTGTLDQTKQVLGTLVDDMKARGLLG